MKNYCLNFPKRKQWLERVNQILVPTLKSLPIEIMVLICEYGTSFKVNFGGKRSILFEMIELFNYQKKFPVIGAQLFNVIRCCFIGNKCFDLLSDYKWHRRLNSVSNFTPKRVCYNLNCTDHRIPDLPRDAFIILNTKKEILNNMEGDYPIISTLHEESISSGFCLFQEFIF